MSKEVEKVACPVCESEYKVIYNYEDANGIPRYCAFCGEEAYNDDVKLEEDTDE